MVAIRASYGTGPRDHIVLVSTYFKFNIPTILHTERLEETLNIENRVFICADTNGHSKLWYYPVRNKRGKIVEDLISKYDLAVHNVQGKINTYGPPGMGTSNIDVTMTTPSIKYLIASWDVIDATDSDHRVLSFELTIKKSYPVREAASSNDPCTADWDLFRSTLLGEVSSIPESDINASLTYWH